MLALWPGEPSPALTRAVGVGSVAASFVLALLMLVLVLERDEAEAAEVGSLWEWIDIGGLTVDLAILVDPLSILMTLVITGVGSLIIVYSTEYMAHERDYRRFFAEMCFFVFAMLLLVLAANFVFLIVGWALVGLASYLLIGFYYERPSAVAAAKKAFVVNVIGDVGMVLAAFLLVRELGVLDYASVFAAAPEGLGQGSGVSEAVALLLFVGAAAKSAQVPLHTWLADAMEGPTPVSALIHAATMVTAGVYLIVRTNVLYDLAPVAGDVVAIVGAVTLFLAATVALAQEDIKRVLAWSTISQIGYMIMAAGLGLYASAMFHFLTHAFFKALLFLAVGIVIHALLDQQSLDGMGGLRRRLPLAYGTTLVGCLAISGIPPFSGFFSKDEILAHALDAGALGVVLGIVGLLAAGLTALYMFRLLFRAFHGPKPEGGYVSSPPLPARPERVTPHGSGLAMSAPVVVLAVLASVGGLLQVPGAWHLLEDFLHPSLIEAAEVEVSVGSELIVLVGSLLLGGLGIAGAWYLFGADPARRLRLAGRARAGRAVLEDAYRVDAIYDAAVVAPGRGLGDAFARDVEPYGVQGLVAAASGVARLTGRGLALAQTGLVRGYAAVIVVGTAIVGVIFWIGLG